MHPGVRLGVQYGDKCDFSHDPEVLFPKNLMARSGYREMCFRWMERGSCYLGDECTFAHGEHELRGAARGGQPDAWGTRARDALSPPPGQLLHPALDLDWEAPQHAHSGYPCALAFPFTPMRHLSHDSGDHDRVNGWHVRACPCVHASDMRRWPDWLLSAAMVAATMAATRMRRRVNGKRRKGA